MIPNMKFYVISIVSIFAALGIGIYIGFTLDTQSFVDQQKEDIAIKLEEKFDFFKNENEDLKALLKDIQFDNDNYKEFIDITFEDIVNGKLEGQKVAIIETKNDYMYSGVGQVLEIAGADVIHVTTITDKIMNEDILKEIYNDLEIPLPKNDLVSSSIEEVTMSIISGEENALTKRLVEDKLVDIVGIVNKPIDHIIVAGGSIKEDKARINLVDKTIINIAKDMDKQIIGIEKFKTNSSYIQDYKNLKINTVDNIDTPMGKVALVLSMEGRPGHYGIKETSEQLVPDPNLPIVEHPEER